MAEVYDSNGRCKSVSRIDKNGNRMWFNEKGEYHRENGPAVEYNNGGKCWYINGVAHREDGPAFERIVGGMGWYLYGEMIDEEFL